MKKSSDSKAKKPKSKPASKPPADKESGGNGGSDPGTKFGRTMTGKGPKKNR